MLCMGAGASPPRSAADGNLYSLCIIPAPRAALLRVVRDVRDASLAVSEHDPGMATPCGGPWRAYLVLAVAWHPTAVSAD